MHQKQHLNPNLPIPKKQQYAKKQHLCSVVLFFGEEGYVRVSVFFVLYGVVFL